MRKTFFFWLLWGIYVLGAAQYYPTQYRPGKIDWQQLKTPHFRIVFPAGNDSVAWRSGRILENQYKEAVALTGGTLSDFPVILTDYNDLSNGFVTSLHFRSEIDIHTFKGKSLNPRSGNWLETVEPHELIHAAQFNNMGSFGIGKVTSLFSPDLARSFHGAIPAGIDEGLAVYHETEEVVSGGGRGNYPYFNNRFNAYLNSNDSWSMGQLVHSPIVTRPFLRHYMGGYQFTHWLHDNYGEEISREALDLYIRWPFLGYGFALKAKTGEWPGALYDRFIDDKRKATPPDEETYQDPKIMDLPYDGVNMHRPKWIDESTLIFYASLYDARPGFYRYEIESKRVERLFATNIVQDYQYDLSPDKKKLIYSHYKPSAIYDNTFKVHVREIDLSDRRFSEIRSIPSLYAPVYRESEVLALAHRHASNKLVSYSSGQITEDLASLGKDKIIQVAVNPEDSRQWAVVANKRGVQALWIVDNSRVLQSLEAPPLISFKEGSVFDPAWNPDGKRLLLTSDIGVSMNIYEYNTTDQTLRQLTNTRYNSYEAAYGPGGERIAFVQQVKNESFPAMMGQEEFYGKVIDRSLWTASEPKNLSMQRPEVGSNVDTSTGQWTTSSYSAGIGWLKPRTVLPIFEEVGNRGIYKAGIQLHSNSLLQDQSYAAGFSWFENRAWYNVNYRNKQFFPGYKVRVFSKPGFRSITFPDANGDVTKTFLRQERAVALSIPVPITLKNNISFSSFRIEPEFRYSQIRFFELDHDRDPASNFADTPIANISTSLAINLQQNIRDVQPNSGVIIFSEAEKHISSEDLVINTLNSRFRASSSEPEAIVGGIFSYLSLFKRWNQSLRLGLAGITQDGKVFDNQFLVSNGFSEPVFAGSDHLLSLSARYTIPFWYADDGGFLLPLYLSNLYFVAFSNTVSPFTEDDLINSSRSVFGLGVRAQFKLSNLLIDIGIGVGYEPMRNNTNLFLGDF